MNFDPTLRCLENHGYTVKFREAGWVECLVSLGRERWFGSGETEGAALDHAVLMMFPSQLARSLLDALIAPRDEVTEVQPAPVEAQVAPEVVAAQGAADSAGRPVEAPREQRVAARVELPKALDPAADGHLEAIDELVDEIIAREAQLAMSAPVRQRLVITGWIADARRAQDEFPHEERVRSAVARVASRLSRLCKVWWCGSVRALQVDRRPDAVTSELPYRCESAPRDWAEVAEFAREMLERMDHDDAQRALDPSGWADADALFPAPSDPDAALAEVLAEIESVAGPTEYFPPRQSATPVQLARWIAKLRWLRGSMIDAAQWAYAMGRCRYWADRERSIGSEVNSLLDPTYRPEHPWAARFTAQTRDRERRKLVKQVLSEAPAHKDHPDRAALLAWLLRALPLADTHHRQIVELMRPFSAEVLRFEPASMEELDRRLRRRMLLLQRDLGGAVEAEEAPEEAEPAPVHEAPEAGTTPFLDAVRGRTHGSRALFISNRNDPMLHDRLIEVLEFSALDWCEADVKRTQAAEHKVAAGAYDFVLAATGFLSHSVDGRLAKVCRARSIPYVRVERGRPMTCVRSLARDLGIHG